MTRVKSEIALALLKSTLPLAASAAAHGLSEAEGRDVIDRHLAAKASLGPERIVTSIPTGAEIVRDARGVPHIAAETPRDLSFAFGFAEAQDRLWQLDYLRRQAHGTLSEVYGPETLQADILSRTLDITGIAQRCLDALNPESREMIEAFSDGVNAWLNALPAGLPVEFELLGYEPEPWRPIDSLAILRRWWWYLTGRLNVLTTPEVLRAALQRDDRVEAFFLPDAPVATIVSPGHYDPSNPWPAQPMDPPSAGFGNSTFPAGSNNWVAAPSVTRDGNALLASDPHVYFTVPAEWYEVHLRGAGIDAFGACYPGIPGILFGRNRDVAWGITNNICSLRDLYVEPINPADASQYRDGDAWTAVEERIDEIVIRGGETHRHTTRSAHGRPIVDHLLPAAALPANLWGGERFASTALSLAWVGLEASDEMQSLIELSRSASVAAAREAYRGWRCPTFNIVLADGNGSIGYQAIGALPLRGRERRGYRFADEPLDAWQGTIPFEGLPAMDNPDRGWISTANNRTAPPDFPYPLFGTWAPEDRAPRAEHLLATRQPHTIAGFRGMQTDIHSGRAERGTPGLLSALEHTSDPRTIEARDLLAGWNFSMATGEVGPSLYYVFLWRWHQHVVGRHVPEGLKPHVIDSGWGLSASLLHNDVAGWFSDDAERIATISQAFGEAIDWLANRFGGTPADWMWGRLHRLGAAHPAARTALQHEILDLPPRAHGGGASTLAAAFHLPAGSFDTRFGANYRFLADLGPAATTEAICWPGQSGNPGSPHYRDQVDPHLSGGYATVSMDWEEVVASAEHRTTLEPIR